MVNRSHVGDVTDMVNDYLSLPAFLQVSMTSPQMPKMIMIANIDFVLDVKLNVINTLF